MMILRNHTIAPTFVTSASLPSLLLPPPTRNACILPIVKRRRLDAGVLPVRRSVPLACERTSGNGREGGTGTGSESISPLFETQGDAKPFDSMSGLTGPQGFALADAKEFTFSELTSETDKFQRGGAYAILNNGGDVVYMGYTKNLSSKLQFHSRLQPESCVSFRVYVPPVPPELMSPEMFESVLEYWVREIGHVPRGNTTDRALWENPKPVDKQARPAEENVEEEPVPVRQRTTPRRTVKPPDGVGAQTRPRYYTADPFADAYRSSSPKSPENATAARQTVGWDANKEDYVDVDVDPFDPFSASGPRPSRTRSSWADLDNDDDSNGDWYPLLFVMGLAGVMWLASIVGNAIPAATTSVGM